MKKKTVKRTIVSIVRKYLVEFHKKGSIGELPFDKIAADIRRSHPDSKFNPSHLAWYKHKFLLNEVE